MARGAEGVSGGGTSFAPVTRTSTKRGPNDGLMVVLVDRIHVRVSRTSLGYGWAIAAGDRRIRGTSNAAAHHRQLDRAVPRRLTIMHGGGAATSSG
jgi:hypothetical protein